MNVFEGYAHVLECLARDYLIAAWFPQLYTHFKQRIGIGQQVV